MATAIAESGFDDFGDDRLPGALAEYLRAIVAELHPGVVTAFAVKAFVHPLLVNRLRFHEDLKRHPEILDEDVSDPIVIVGLPRTGTTKLQRMMSQDPDVQGFWLWRGMNPAPFPGSEGADPDPRIAVAEQFVAAAIQQAPVLLTVHSYDAREPEEDVLLQEMTFESIGIGIRSGTFDLLFRLLVTDQHNVYEYERRLLQYLQWQDGGKRGRPWVLKTPIHLGNIATLIDTFPGATVVHCHRDPRVAVASLASLFENFQRSFTMQDPPDLAAFGSNWLECWSGEMAKYMAQRDELGDRLRILDVPYADIREDTLAVIAEAYRLHGRELSREARQRMNVWDGENPAGRFGAHKYTLERYGLTEARVDEAFAPYVERFIPTRESE